MVQSDDKKRARINCITHLLSLIDYKDLTPEKVSLEARPPIEKSYVRPPMEDQNFVPNVSKALF